jgi:glycogen operon protein
VHLRGLTMNDSSVATSLQGTYAGAATKASTLAALGVTAVELLPIHETQNDTNDQAQASANYWGYSTLAFFAPDRRFSSDKSLGGPTREFKAMVNSFHAAGIKVFLDVVYNHTAEGGVSSGTAELLSFRGLDNAAYYELASGNQSPVDDTGTGGNFNTGNGIVRDLAIDSLTYWVHQMGVDGFRFDLAAVLGNSCTSVCYTFSPGDPNGILARAAAAFPGMPLIAEPWGVGTGTYQQGNFPTGWSEWNGEFRDGIRTAQNQQGVTAIAPSTLVARVEGSPDLFSASGRTPSASINFVDCHDGFTLNDEYAYDAPQNAQAYPLGPSTGGSTSDYPWDQGGDAGAQTQAARTGLGIVAVSAGVPMFQGGDEMVRTQYGNNNAYNLDDSSMWLDWSLATTNAPFVTWTTSLFAFRAAHTALRPAAFWTGTDHNGNGLPDVAFLDNTGAVASAGYLSSTTNYFLAWRVDGTEATPADAARSVYVAWNGWTSEITATVPAPASSTTAWYVVGDSASGAFATPGQETALTGTTLPVAARSIAVLLER